MKYSSSTRLLNLVIFAILFLAFGFLAIWFGFLETPYLYNGLVGSPLHSVISAPTEISWALSAEIGVLGIAVTIISGFGLYFAIMGILKKNDDELVKSAFSCYVAIGYCFVLLFLLNATWLYRTTTTNFGDGYSDIAFAIVVYAVITIVLVLLTNVPFVKLYGEETNITKMLKTFILVILAVNIGVALVFLSTYAASTNVDTLANRAIFMNKLLVLGLLPLGAAIVSGAAYFFAWRDEKSGGEHKLPSLLFEGSLLFDVAGFIVAGVICYIQGDATTSIDYSLLNKITKTAVNPDYMDFLVMSVIVGSFLFFADVALLFSTLRGNKKKVDYTSL